MNRLLSSIKTTLRISHDKLDGEIKEYIAAAREEMIRAGVAPSVARSQANKLVRDAIKVFCQMKFTTDSQKHERFLTSWKYQLDNLRKSEGYMKER